MAKQLPAAGTRPAVKKTSLRKNKALPLHRELLAYFFVVITLTTLSLTLFAAGYAIGQRETLASSTNALETIRARWQALQSRGVIPQGPSETHRVTGRVRAVADSGFLLAADPVRFDLFSDEPSIRAVTLGPGATIVDAAADGSGISAAAPLAIGDIVAVTSSSDIRTSQKIVADRVQRFAR